MAIRRSELVIALALGLISEGLIGFVDLFELLFCAFISSILIWMILHGFLFVCLLDLSFCGGLAHAEGCVVVSWHMDMIIYTRVDDICLWVRYDQSL